MPLSDRMQERMEAVQEFVSDSKGKIVEWTTPLRQRGQQQLDTIRSKASETWNSPYDSIMSPVQKGIRLSKSEKFILSFGCGAALGFLFFAVLFTPSLYGMQRRHQSTLSILQNRSASVYLERDMCYEQSEIQAQQLAEMEGNMGGTDALRQQVDALREETRMVESSP